MNIGDFFRRLAWRLFPRNEYTDIRLRELFASKYDIHVGLYSYGCFDPNRVYPGTHIGRYCSFSNSCRVVNRNHPSSSITFSPYLYQASLGRRDAVDIPNKRCVIEDDVWIGHNAIVLPSATHVGRGSAIGAGAIVTHNVPPYSIIAGNPGRVIRKRFSEPTIELLESIRWWEWDAQQLVDFAENNPDIAGDAELWQHKFGGHGT